MSNTPDLRTYEWVVINSSAGKDSQAMLDVVVERTKHQGIDLARVVVVHADLQEEEWPGCKELAAEHAQHYGVRFAVVKRKQGGILAHVRERHKTLVAQGKKVPPWPSSPNRWCTSDHKRGQVARLLTRLTAETRARSCSNRRVKILNCLGMRAAESCARAKLVPFAHNEAMSNGRRSVDTYLPLHSWSADEVWARIATAGTRSHPAYALGMPRLSCCFCIFAPRSALMLAGKHNRALLDEYVQVEQETGFSFRKELRLADVRDALDRGEEPGEVRTWEM